MLKVFQSSTISKILSTNKPNTIEVNNDNIIESDSEFREVIKKGYLLTQINLSTIPDIIQDAIDKAILDAKTQTLADSLISTMRQSIENLGDGVYKKTYIDQTITYLEELLIQKASPEIVASIAEAKIAVATAEFATASQVNILSSRVNSSEAEIISIKETITTKDEARATQIEDLQASINQNLSNYSDVIELYIDADGNIRSQKIENLEAKNSLKKVSITELNQVVLDEAGNYSAIVANAILDSDGKIVGFTFSDTNELTTFTINADTFKISNSTNTRTPFRIENNELYFDGKVSFSNITDKTSVVTMDNVEDAITNNVTTIDGSKIATGSIVSHQIEANAITGKNITGGTIRGTQIIGSVIKGSFIDLTTTLALTNWQYYTPATVPSMYADNFAHYNDGGITVDSQGYVRLPGQQNFMIPSIISSGTISGTTTRTLNIIYEIYSWDSYKVNTLNRSIRQDTSFTSTAELVFSGYGGGPSSQSEHAGYDASFSFRFLDKNISVWISSFGSNDDTVANSSISFNGVAVAVASGSLGIGLDRPWDTGWLDYSTTIKGIPIRIKTTIDAIGAITFEFKAILSSINKIIYHSVDDIIKLNSVSVGGNTITRNLTYNINFPSIWVQ